jgi:2-haloacid dehalogenase
MQLDRRQFLSLAAGAAGALQMAPYAQARAARPSFKALAFDAFPIFDPRPILGIAEALFPGKGMELVNAWRTRQFEYQWLRNLGGRYKDFWQTTEDALVFAAKLLQLDLAPSNRARLMSAYLELEAWPDVQSVLSTLKAAGVRLVFLSNMTRAMLEAGIRNARLDGFFEQLLSTDQVRAYKPDPRAYQMGVDALGLATEEILFVAFAGWDASGAKWFGYPTFWVNRLGLPTEELGATPDATGRDLTDLLRFVLAPR